MNISINKDIEKYQESVVMGLTARQLIFSIASVACGGAIVLLTYRYVGLTGSAYIAIPVVAPLALNGFYSYQGMSFTQMFKRKLWFAFKNRPLTYISEESEKNIKRMRMEEERQRKKEDKKKNRRSNKSRSSSEPSMISALRRPLASGAPRRVCARRTPRNWPFSSCSMATGWRLNTKPTPSSRAFFTSRREPGMLSSSRR